MAPSSAAESITSVAPLDTPPASVECPRCGEPDARDNSDLLSGILAERRSLALATCEYLLRGPGRTATAIGRMEAAYQVLAGEPAPRLTVTVGDAGASDVPTAEVGHGSSVGGTQ